MILHLNRGSRLLCAREYILNPVKNQPPYSPRRLQGSQNLSKRPCILNFLKQILHGLVPITGPLYVRAMLFFRQVWGACPFLMRNLCIFPTTAFFEMASCLAISLGVSPWSIICFRSCVCSSVQCALIRRSPGQ